MKILVCGGRNYNDRQKLNRTLDNIHRIKKISAVVHGDARGADTLAKEWATINCVEHIPYAADWQLHGFSAGPLRNRKMLDEEKPVAVIAFPGGKGTADMVKYAKSKHVEVIEINDD